MTRTREKHYVEAIEVLDQEEPAQDALQGVLREVPVL